MQLNHTAVAMAPKTRKSNKHLPERVYIKHGAYYFVDANNKWLRLGKTFPEAMAKWAEVINKPVRIAKMNDLFDRYMLEVAPKKAPATYKSNLREIKPLRIAFGNFSPEDITQVLVYQYKDARANAGAPVAANREKALLSAVFSKAIEWGIVTKNPCWHVKRNKETPRQHTPTDEEIEAVKKVASDVGKGMAWLSRLTALRMVDLLSFKLTSITETGIELVLSKTKVRWECEWDDQLRSCFDFIRKIKRPIKGMYLFCNRKGQPYTQDGFESIWQRDMQRALDQKVIEVRFQFRDLRRKALRDAEKKYGKDYARMLAGHLNEKTTTIYLGKTIRVKPLR
jgi:hypothetical protein